MEIPCPRIDIVVSLDSSKAQVPAVVDAVFAEAPAITKDIEAGASIAVVRNPGSNFRTDTKE